MPPREPYDDRDELLVDEADYPAWERASDEALRSLDDQEADWR